MAKNIVAIVGKPNVGKSSLYNKLIGKRISIVHDEPGVTRDRLYHSVNWVGNDFTIIDTGGIHIEDKPFQEQIKLQAQIAIEEAEVILFVVDGITGLDKNDEFIIRILRKSAKKLILVPNKLEGRKEMDYSIYGLGIEEVFPISAIHGEGIGDLLDSVISKLDFSSVENDDVCKLAIIGRPNSGKSTLLNSLSGSERAIVSPISGTTRDSIDAIIGIEDIKFKIIDTAGINKKSKLIETVDHYALGRAMSSLEESDISILLIDALNDISHFDSRIAGYAMDNDKPIIIVINKWDLVKKENNTMIKFEKALRKQMKFLSWAPIVFISAIKSSRLNKLKDVILEVHANLGKKIKTNILNEMIMDIQLMQPAPSFNGGRARVSFIKQSPTSRVPTFVLFVNNKKHLHFTYQRYIENQLRDYFGFTGVPLKLIIKENKKNIK